LYITIVYIPWSFKILYGLISDNVPIFGSKRKSWLIIMGTLQFVALFSLAIAEPKDPLAVAFILASASLSEAFVNVVADAMMVV
jgi:MFS-type transporter involved in bile tolerance (Atg22 family)